MRRHCLAIVSRGRLVGCNCSLLIACIRETALSNTLLIFFISVYFFIKMPKSVIIKAIQ